MPFVYYSRRMSNKKDTARVSAGLAPEGNKLQIVYAQGEYQKGFQRVLATYSDSKIEISRMEEI